MMMTMMISALCMSQGKTEDRIRKNCYNICWNETIIIFMRQTFPFFRTTIFPGENENEWSRLAALCSRISFKIKFHEIDCTICGKRTQKWNKYMRMGSVQTTQSHSHTHTHTCHRPRPFTTPQRKRKYRIPKLIIHSVSDPVSPRIWCPISAKVRISIWYRTFGCWYWAWTRSAYDRA